MAHKAKRRVGRAKTYLYKLCKDGFFLDRKPSVCYSFHMAHPSIRINYPFLEALIKRRGYKKWGEDGQKTYGEFAELVGISESHLSSILTGKRGVSKRVLKKLALAVGVSEDYLMAHDEDLHDLAMSHIRMEWAAKQIDGDTEEIDASTSLDIARFYR